jgi:Domain of unknown function (DUF1937)
MTLDELKQFRLVYLATPYTKYPRGLDAACYDACALAGKLYRHGLRNIYSPIAHAHPIAVCSGLDPRDYSIWLPHNEAQMEVHEAMAIGMLEGWRESFGIAHEYETFVDAGKPIYFIHATTLELTNRILTDAPLFEVTPLFELTTQ